MFSTKEYRKFPHEKILEQINSYDVFSKYFEFEIGKLYNSPFRRDSSPSFNIFKGSDGQFYWKDFGYIGGDCVNFIQELFGLTYYQACEKVKNDLLLDNTTTYLASNKSNKSIVNRKEFNIKFLPREFNKLELEYWQQYGISKQDLIDNEIWVAEKLFINSKQQYLKANELKFIYRFTKDGQQEAKKIYTPNSENYKWFGSCSSYQIEGLNQLPFKSDSVVIQKSRKDKICTSKIFSDVISTQNENYKNITDELTNFLDLHYKKKYIFWDSDGVGVEQCKKLNEKGYLYLNIPKKIHEETGCKDISDVISYYGQEEGYTIIAEEMDKKGISLI